MDERIYERRFRRFIILLGVLIFVFCLIIAALFKVSVIAHNYYTTLANTNKTKEVLIQPPRGVFFDRDNTPLVINEENKRYGYIRKYLFPEEYAHVLGYVGLPGNDSLNDHTCGKPPLSEQYMGKTGLEKYFECRVRGIPGKILYEIDARGQKKSSLARNNSQQGENITLSLSTKLQKIARSQFGEKKGAVIASNPENGEIYLFYSSPSFDSNIFFGDKTGEEYNSLVQNKDKPLLNRLTQALYPPGSVIKPFIALAALADGIITSQTTYEDTGIFKFGGIEFGNWYFLQYGKKEGPVNVEKAIMRSNDIYFYQVGLKLGAQKMASWFKRFRLLADDLRPYFSQVEGLIPTEEWKKRTLREKWYLGDTVNMSIGQGYTLLSPSQIQQGVSLVASGGKECPFTFLKGERRHCKEGIISPTDAQTVINGMVQACDTGGTGWPFFDFKINGKRVKVACKTGTAESVNNKTNPHAWFTVFAPVEKPRIAMTVLVENGGEGSSVAAPIAKKILEEFLSVY